MQKTAEMWNQVFEDHRKQSPNFGRVFDMGLRGRKKFGLCWRERLLCTECNYKSNTFNLFEEEKSGNPGRRPACINQGLQVGLSQTSIGPSSFSKLLCSISTPPPSASGMQKCANKTMPNIRKENIDDMMLRCQDLQSFKSLCGKDTKAVNVQADGCYNNALYSGVGKTPFQPSTQAIYVVAENETNKKQIINVQTKSKLCSKRKHGSGIQCQHSGECFANIDMASNIGNEEECAKHSFSELASAGLEVEYLTTDPDSSSYRAAMRLYADGVTSVEPKHLLDTRHVSHNHRKYI